MSSRSASAWAVRVDRLLGRPTMNRASVMLATFAGATIVTGSLGIWLIGLTGQTRMAPFSAVLVGWQVSTSLSWLVVALRARSDPDASHRSNRVLLATAAVVNVGSGVAFAYVLGFWATPFLLLPPTTAVIVGIVFGRGYGWLALASALLFTAALEALRLADVIPYAPAMRERSIDGSAEVVRVVANSVPLGAFSLAAAALAFAVLAVVDRQRDALTRTHALIRTYVPAQVADAVLQNGDEVTALERRKITIFFSDVVSFTETTERTEPEDLARVLDDYFSEMARIADAHDGTIDELIGDAVLIFFGAPTATTDRDHALRAVRMAVEMQEAITRLNAAWARDGIDVVFEVRMGINTGVVTVGNVGTGPRRKYAALGRAVNLAARVQAQCPPGRVLLSRPTWLLVQDEIACTGVGEVELKGIARPVELFEVAVSTSAAPA